MSGHIKQTQKCIDGCTAVSLACYKFIDFASIFPITPSSPMAEMIELYSSQGQKNLFGNVVTVRQAQAELGAIGACHGAATAGSLAASFTCSQGVLLMISNMYHIAGERLPFVLHMSNRTVGAAATSLAADHTDLYSFEGTNFCCLGSCNVQEAYDMAIVAHAAAIEGQAAFCHFFEGYRVSHQFETLDVMGDEDLARFLNKEAVMRWRNREALDTDRNNASNIGLGPEVHFQLLESQKAEFDQIPGICEKYFGLLKEMTGREYHCYEYHGHPEAEMVMVIMGAASQTMELVVDALVARTGARIGCLKVRLFRPFSTELFAKAIPETCRVVVALDRAPELVQAGGTIYRETLASLMKEKRLACTGGKVEFVAGGRFSVAGWELRPTDVMSIVRAFDLSAHKVSELPADFCVGILDDLRGKALARIPVEETPAGLLPEGTSECVLWGIGADGTIGACRNAMKILSDRTGCECQANFEFDGKKSGGTTISYLRFGSKKIRAQYNIEEAGYIACHTQAYIGRFDVLRGAKEGAVFVLNTEHDTLEALESFLPADVKKTIAAKRLQFYAINANKVAKAVGLGGRINTIMILFFFKYGLGSLLDFDTACEDLKAAAKITYAKQKAEVIEANIRAVDTGKELIEQCRVNYDREAWLNPDPSKVRAAVTYGPAQDQLCKELIMAVNDRHFDHIPTSYMRKYNGGKFPGGYAKYEKLGAALTVPKWDSTKCIQCGFCSVECPHASIRNMVVDADRKPADMPEDLVTIPYTGNLPAVNPDKSKLSFAIVVSPLDCRGCGLCAKACPKAALTMVPVESVMPRSQQLFDYAYDKIQFTQGAEKIDPFTCTLKELQLRFPYMQFPGSCPGCGESNTMKLLTSIVGESLVLSVGIGCSLVWMHYNLIRPFDMDGDSRGISSCASLFEDNSVFGWGVMLAREAARASVQKKLEDNMEQLADGELKEAAQAWLSTYEDARANLPASRRLRSAVGIERLATGEYANHPEYKLPADFSRFHGVDRDVAEYLASFNVYLPKTSHWIVGGDGWAYDIDFGGVDHVLASRDRVRLLIMVNHCFANTGGQKSKATPLGAVCKHAAAGVGVAEKKMGLMMMSYENVYVGQIALGANRMQAMKVFREAEAYNGSSIVLAYCPCISHMVVGGLVNQERQQKLAVETGVWPIYTYNPALPFGSRLKLDCKEPAKPISDFLETEQRFGALQKKNPQRYEELKALLQEDVKAHWRALNCINGPAAK